MKKFVFCLCGMFFAMSAFGMISPLDIKLQRAQREYTENQIRCPDNRPLYIDGDCVACDKYDNWDDVAAIFGCERCSNSHECFGNHCCINCPENRPVMLSNGACVACDYESENGAPIYDIVSGCEKCADGAVCKNAVQQKVKNNKLDADNKCLDTAPILTSDGKCEPCYHEPLTGGRYVVSGCDRCFGRQVINGGICD